MSWDMWHINGIGIDIENVGPEKYRDFVLNHKDFVTYKEVIGYLKTPECVDDGCFIDTIRDMTKSWTISEPIAEIISAETGIRFHCPGLSENGIDCILFSPCFPWEMNEKEKNLKSIDDVADILKPYADELGVNVDEEIDCIYEG